MRLTPIEIRRHRFGKRVRGLDEAEVHAFLETVVADFEEVVRENAQLRREAERLARELDGFRGRERNLQDTLTTAQSVVDQLKRTAIKESEVIVSEAELRAETLVRDAEARRAQVLEETSQLRHLRRRVEHDVRRTVEGYVHLLDAFREHASPSDLEGEEEPKPGL